MRYRVTLFIVAILLGYNLTGIADKQQKTSDDKKPARVEQADRNATTKSASAPTAGETVDTLLEPVEISAGEEPAMEATEEAADHMVPWKSINGGGGNAETATHKVSVSIGQAAIGFATTASHQAGIGYWYGISNCDCGLKGDMNCDGYATPLDIVILINYVYKEQDDICSAPNCPYATGDLDCNELIYPLDVIYHINLVYKEVDNVCDGCAVSP